MAATASAFKPSSVPPAGSTPAWGDPEPLPAGRPAVAAFDHDLLPGQLQPWVEDLCERMQIPPDFPAVALMVEAGAIIGRQVGIRPKRFDDWLVIPNLFGMVVGRPGLLKTPALREALGAVHELESSPGASTPRPCANTRPSSRSRRFRPRSSTRNREDAEGQSQGQ